MKTQFLPLAFLACCMLFLNSCTKDVVETEEYYYTDAEFQTLQKSLNLSADRANYTFELPNHFLAGSFSQPFVNPDKATLGRVLFYDKALSKNEKVSCASCHDQSKAFADPVAFSEGFDGQLTKRNSFALGAVANFVTSYDGSTTFGGGPGQLFWDNRATTIQEQSTLTLQDPIEMGMDMGELVQRVKSKDYYKVLFDKAFEGQINEQAILDAIAEFINALVVSETRFDEGMNKHFNPTQDFDNFTPVENLGKNIYLNSCASCHGNTHVKASVSAANNGLDMVYEDKGVGEITKVSQDNGVFKVPMLRNIELTGPYMHDGRFETLEEVVEHYNSNIETHPNLHPLLRENFSGDAKKLNLDNNEKEALVAFLKTLTDNRITTAEQFADPFK